MGAEVGITRAAERRAEAGAEFAFVHSDAVLAEDPRVGPLDWFGQIDKSAGGIEEQGLDHPDKLGVGSGPRNPRLDLGPAGGRLGA
ncbi:hypothetical protein HAHE_23820 [Haloferula helveola]|uniref:Uncharacterized protein n=1 Tax=Haloferula helveola TaxID=490095 RepID=A0ABM7RAN4_9BACT|nr:hypothetical protein HAHE_23820 [Haloferula helveola]